jgi:hypothetical protein
MGLDLDTLNINVFPNPVRACLDNLRLEWIEVVCGVLKCNIN